MFSTSIKYINKTLEAIKNRPADSEEDPSILEEILIRGMSPKDAMVMVVDMLMAGIDTVLKFKFLPDLLLIFDSLVIFIIFPFLLDLQHDQFLILFPCKKSRQTGEIT